MWLMDVSCLWPQLIPSRLPSSFLINQDSEICKRNAGRTEIVEADKFSEVSVLSIDPEGSVLMLGSVVRLMNGM